MTRHIANINFPSATDAVVTFTDGTSGYASGVMAVKWRNALRAMVRFALIRPEEQTDNDELLASIRRALEGEIE